MRMLALLLVLFARVFVFMPGTAFGGRHFVRRLVSREMDACWAVFCGRQWQKGKRRVWYSKRLGLAKRRESHVKGREK